MTATEELLREQVRDLTTRLSIATGLSLAGEIKQLLGVENRTARILAMLFKCPGVVSAEFIYGEALADPATGDGPDLQNVKVRISHARSALRAQGAPDTILFQHGLGYRMMPDLRTWLTARLEAAQ